MKHMARDEEKEGYAEEDMVSGACALQGRVCSIEVWHTAGKTASGRENRVSEELWGVHSL